MPQKPTPFSDRLDRARARRQSGSSSSQPDSGRAAREKAVDDYFGGQSQDEGGSWKDYILDPVEKYSPFSFSGLKSDVADLGHKIAHPIETMAPGGPFAKGLGRVIKTAEDFTGKKPTGVGTDPRNTGLAHNAPGDFLAGAGRTLKNWAHSARSAAQDYRDVVEENLPDILGNLRVGPNGGDAIAARSTIEGFLGGTREGAGRMGQSIIQDPVSTLDPGIREAAKNRSGSIPYKLGRVAPPIVGLLAPTKGGRAIIGGTAEGIEGAGRQVYGAVERGLAQRAERKAMERGGQAMLKGGASSQRMPVPINRQLPAFGQTSTGSNVGTMFRGSRAGVIPTDPNIVGPIEFHTPQPASAGMGGTTAAQRTPATAAFEALVPNRYKTGVTAEGLNVPKLGDVTGPPTPGLPVMNKEGKLLRGQAAESSKIKGTLTIPQMMEKYKDIKEVARRANMTVDEVKEMLQPSVKDLAEKGLKSLEKPAPKAPPQVVPEKPKAGKGPARVFKNATDKTLEDLAARGSQDAAAEIQTRAVEKGGLGRLKSETGSIGKNVEQRKIAREKAKPFAYDLEGWKQEQLDMGHSQGEVDEAVRRSTKHGIDPTKSDDLNDLEHFMMAMGEQDWRQESRQLGHLGNKDLMDWHDQNFQPGARKAYEQGTERPSPGKTAWVNEKEAAWQKTMQEVQENQNRMYFEAAKNRDPELHGRVLDDLMRRYPELTPQQADEHLFNRWKETLEETKRLQKIQAQGGDLGRNVWGKTAPEWERPPFKAVEVKPDPTEAQYQAHFDRVQATGQPTWTEEEAMLRPSQQWYAGQDRIDRAQVERVKKFGVNDPAAAADSPPYLEVDMNGNIQLQDGHHRSTAALETGERIPYNVADWTEPGHPTRLSREMDQGFYKGGTQAAEKFKAQLADLGEVAPIEATEAPQGRRSIIGDERGSVGLDINRGRLGNERGAVALPSRATLKKGAVKGINALNEIRLASMLSGWAVPKSMLGNVGAHGIGAIEDLAAGNYGRAGRTIKEGLRLPTNLQNAWEYYKSGQSPQISQLAGPPGKTSWINQPARVMGAFDEASQQSLMRAGRTKLEAQRLQLQDPRYGLKGPGSWMMNYLVPFRKTPFNVMQGGGRAIAEHPLLSLGAAGMGAGVGTTSDDPRVIGLAASLFGPYTLPFLFGAAPTAGLRALQGISPIPEWSITKSIGDPLHPFSEPSALRMFEEPGPAPQSEREKMLNKRAKRGTRNIPKRKR